MPNLGGNISLKGHLYFSQAQTKSKATRCAALFSPQPTSTFPRYNFCANLLPHKSVDFYLFISKNVKNKLANFKTLSVKQDKKTMTAHSAVTAG